MLVIPHSFPYLTEHDKSSVMNCFDIEYIGYDEKVAKEIADGIRHLNKYGELKVTYKADKKPVSVKDDNIEGREFILGFAEDFLGHAVDYSIDDKLDGILGSSK